MSVPRSVSEVLAGHVSLEVEGIDRMYLNVYVPQLQRDTGVVGFFRFHQGYQFVSSALMDPIDLLPENSASHNLEGSEMKEKGSNPNEEDTIYRRADHWRREADRSWTRGAGAGA